MAVKSLEIHPAAVAELKVAVTWYLERSETAALGFADEFDRGIQRILRSPQRWPAAEFGTRRFVMQRFLFAIVYRGTEPVVQVLAIAHGRRRPQYWKDRL
jgi:plasmid stabilization system protein ParE